MRAILEDPRSGQVSVYETPEPELRAGGILVRTHFSVISAGTERAKLEAGQKSLMGKALQRPDLVQQVIDYARANGVWAAYHKVRSRLDNLSPLGYSCAGIIIATGLGVTEFRPGDRVACGGAGYANHAEVDFIPRNLAVSVPEKVPLEQAALTTIGAIAVQGLRQSQAAFGESVAVIGAGLVGVLTVQLARAAGCRVIAIDADARRAEQAAMLGAQKGLVVGDPQIQDAVREFSPDGVDVVILTAATPSSEPIELAGRITRDRGRIVIVGDVGMGISRRIAYAKELSIVCSRSYGPGRYDPQYEEEGKDYPVGYVRWTERRNMEAFLGFLASGAIDVAPLLEQRYPMEKAAQAYEDLREWRAYTALLEYPAVLPVEPALTPVSKRAERNSISGTLRVGCIGAGGFAREAIFPSLRSAKNVVLESVATASGVAAESARRGFGFARTQTPSALLQDPDIDSVFILSRHDSHVSYVAAAISDNKLVFVEKPLATRRGELEEIRSIYERKKKANGSPFLMVGFNRRFAPLTGQLRSFFSKRREPMMIHVRINAGFLPRDHWTQQKSGGGRIVGELCHFVDWARSLIGVPIERVWAAALPDGWRYSRDNVAVTLSFRDGSLTNLLYLANGDRAVAKEYYEVFCEGGIARLEDFRTLELTRNGKTRCVRAKQDKGHREELERTLKAMITGQESPIPFDQLCEVTEATFAIEEAIAAGSAILLCPTTTVPVAAEKEPGNVLIS